MLMQFYFLFTNFKKIPISVYSDVDVMVIEIFKARPEVEIPPLVRDFNKTAEDGDDEKDFKDLSQLVVS